MRSCRHLMGHQIREGGHSNKNKIISFILLLLLLLTTHIIADIYIEVSCGNVTTTLYIYW